MHQDLLSRLGVADDPRLLARAAAANALKHTIPGDFTLVSLAEVEALAAGGHGGRVQR